MTNRYKDVSFDSVGAPWLLEHHPFAVNRDVILLDIYFDLDTSYYPSYLPSGYPVKDVAGLGTLVLADNISEMTGLLLYDLIDYAGAVYEGSQPKVALLVPRRRPLLTYDLLPAYDVAGEPFDKDLYQTRLQALGFFLQ